MGPCLKVLGADFELANAMEGAGPPGQAAWEAARRLLEEIPGYPRAPRWGGTAIEWGRRFLAGNGGSAYIDSDHLEINLPEHTRAADHAAHVHAGFAIARRAQEAATAKLPRGGRINLMASVSDGRHSWGHHLNVMVRRRLFDDLFTRKPHLAGFLATHLATATLYTGQGQVGAGNERPACDYQLAQRPDWFEEMVGHQTTYRRPLLNLRDEPHAGPGLARMHIIFFDNALCPVANYLKAGTTQLVLALAEAGWADPALALDDPLAAAWDVSRDLSLRRPLRLAGRGRTATAGEVQKRLAELAGEFVAAGEAEECVPGAAEIVRCWLETLDLLGRRELAALGRRCDWALKYLVLDRQRGRRGLSWRSAEMKCLDLLYASLDPREGLFLQLASAGGVDAMPGAEQINRFVDQPPEETRAWLRAHVLRRFGEEVTDVDWGRIRFRTEGGHWWSDEGVLWLPDPAGFGRATAAPLLERCATAGELIEAVGESEPRRPPAGLDGYREPWGERAVSYPCHGPYGW
ncbi:MAG TPA: proteasome accessory factor PafA2 family protein [Gemmataceae bacterium]|jgi:proteasome accessory factor A|nr:proteasome accessory factor PafA2 family protein [Gemmataceae bacterium]